MPAGSEHPFARTMHEHFKRTPLRGLTQFPTIVSQRERFKSLGWGAVEVTDLWSLWNHPGFIADAERRGMDDIEPFDEWEGLALWAGHSFLLLASTTAALDTAKQWFSRLLPHAEEVQRERNAPVNVTIDAVPNPRGYGRVNGSATSLSDLMFIHSGGSTMDARHDVGDIYTCGEDIVELPSMPPVATKLPSSLAATQSIPSM